MAAADTQAREGAVGAGLRILLITNMWPSEANPVFGVFVERHVRALRDAGAQVTVVANTDTRTGGLAAARKYASLALRSWWAARRGRHDAIVGHYLYPTATFARAAARRAKAPLVLVAHGTDTISVRRDDRFGRGGREALGGADLVVTVSRALEQVVLTELGLPESVPTAVVNMGLDAATFHPDPVAREKLRLDAGERIALFAGNLTHGKGVDVLLDAFIAVLDEGYADRLVLIGSGPLEDELRHTIGMTVNDYAHADATERVTFTGRLAQRDLALWMAAADVFVLPSRAEGLGLVTLEAMACGTPCVGTTIGGIPEVLVEPGCGRLVPPDDAAALSSAIADVIAAGKLSYREACLAQAAAHTTHAKAAEMISAIRGVL